MATVAVNPRVIVAVYYRVPFHSYHHSLRGVIKGAARIMPFITAFIILAPRNAATQIGRCHTATRA